LKFALRVIPEFEKFLETKLLRPLPEKFRPANEPLLFAKLRFWPLKLRDTKFERFPLIPERAIELPLKLRPPLEKLRAPEKFPPEKLRPPPEKLRPPPPPEKLRPPPPPKPPP
jgi:hypothetical protein